MEEKKFLKDYAANALFDEFDIEVDEETDSFIGKFEISAKLRFVQRSGFFDSFELANNYSESE